MNRNNKYIITIQFSGNSNNIKFEEKINYLSGGGYKDLLCITNNLITIEAYRSSNINLDNIFYNNTSSMYFQIIKSLVFYYCITTNFTKIKSIAIKRFGKNNNELNAIEIPSDKINQVIHKEKLLKNKFEPIVVSQLFGENKLGKSLLVTTSYVLKSTNADTESNRFDYLWRAFNSIYSLSGKRFERDKLREVVKYIKNKPSSFPLSIKKASIISEKHLGNTIRVRGYILNIHKNHVINTLTQYKDKRINKLFKARLSNNAFKHINEKTKELIDKNLDNNIKSNNDVDMICFLCSEYMYFVRNKLFHGERLDSSFRLTENKELEELNYLSDILELILVDLINHNSEYKRYLKI